MNIIAVLCKYACYFCNAVSVQIFTNIATKFVSHKNVHTHEIFFIFLCCSVVCLFYKNSHLHSSLSSATHVTNTTLSDKHTITNTVEKELHTKQHGNNILSSSSSSSHTYTHTHKGSIQTTRYNKTFNKTFHHHPSYDKCTIFTTNLQQNCKKTGNLIFCEYGTAPSPKKNHHHQQHLLFS